MSRHETRGRRIALPPPERVARGLRARLNVTALLAVLLPVLTIGALSLVSKPEEQAVAHPPQKTELNLASLTCPSSITDVRDVSIASGTGTAGDVEVTQSGSTVTKTVAVPADSPTEAEGGERAVMVRGVDEMAPGLIASRIDDGPAAVSCRSPGHDQWFTGLGAAARHSSVLELINPDPGPAVADITVLGARGPVDAPSLRGITVPGGRSLRLDLSHEIPLRGELAAHVVVSRGRLGVYAQDSFDQLGRGEAGVDWLSAQEPDQNLLLLGLPAGTGSRSLVLANDGAVEARATVRVVTKDSAFRPRGLDEVRVPPQSVKRVPLSAILGAAVKDGALGVAVEANHPVTATLRSFVDGDISHAVPLVPISAATQVILPAGQGTVLLTSEAVGSAKVLARLKGGGQKVVSVDLAPGRTASVRLPKDAVMVQVTPSGTGVRGAVVVTDGGAAVLGLRDLILTGLVPNVRPALP
jgi:hypothetical protein